MLCKFKSKNIGGCNPRYFHLHTFWDSAFFQFPKELNSLPEQYVLGHFIETTETNILNPSFIDNVKNFIQDNNKFDVSFIIENFQKKILINPKSRNYYIIIREIAKLNRSELKEFKIRFTKTIEKAKNQEFTIPYRITSLITKCGFVFIPLQFEFADKYKNALLNYTEANKYDQKLDKSVGVIVYHNPTTGYFDIFWSFTEYKWESNAEMEKLLADNYPFRKTNKVEQFRYFVNK